MPPRRVSSGSPWEDVAGYSRAVRSGPFIAVAGTTAVDKSGASVGVGDPYAQAKHIFSIVEDALLQVDAKLDHVIRTRMYVTDIRFAEGIMRAHKEVFDHVRPAATLVAVGELVRPELLVEIEVDAYLDS